MPERLPWLVGAILLALVMILAVSFVKPIGASTEFVVTDAIIWDLFDDSIVQTSETSKTGYTSSNAYIDASGGKVAKAAANPLNYSMVFLTFMMIGAFLSSRFGGEKPVGEETSMPIVWKQRFGNSKAKRYAAAFVGGFLVLFGARLAGGCTSGHMLSGMMQTSLSGYLFAIGMFSVAIPFAIILYPRKNKSAKANKGE